MEKGYHEIIPEPALMIKSIAEQGYSLETALSDLIDNSITAKAPNIQILSYTSEEKLKMIISDDGEGMDNHTLFTAMKLPAKDMAGYRSTSDLGRFGLGLKTASFSQSKKFTVISKLKKYGSESSFSAFTWDLAVLESKARWLVKELSSEEISEYLDIYTERKSLTNNIEFENFNPVTVIFWEEMFKFDSLDMLNSSLSNSVNSHISLVFHRFLEGFNSLSKLDISINNNNIQAFNPFNNELSRLEQHTIRAEGDNIKIQGYVIPKEKIKNVVILKEMLLPDKSLSDLEGIYLYRENRIIYYGGWPRLLKRKQHLKLGRLQIEITNRHDTLFQINVAKSTFSFPRLYFRNFKSIVDHLDREIYDIYFKNRVYVPAGDSVGKNLKEVVIRSVTSKGIGFSMNEENAVYTGLFEKIGKDQQAEMKFILKSLLKEMNYYANLNREISNEEFVEDSSERDSAEPDKTLIDELGKMGYDKNEIAKYI